MQPNVSTSSVRRILDESGYHRRKAHKVVWLDERHKQGRLSWAKENQRRTDEQWAKIIWSDEVYIHIGDDRGTVWVTRRPGEEYDEKCVVPTFAQSPLRIMLWGCIMKGKKGPLIALEYPSGKGGGMTAKRYQEQVLEPVLIPFMSQMVDERGPNVAFQQDRAPSHRAKSTQGFLAAHNVRMFPHPAKSPDMNPIEPLWSRLKKLIREGPHIPTNLAELEKAALDAWDKITERDIDAHVKHMRDRVKDVLRAKGGYTKY